MIFVFWKRSDGEQNALPCTAHSVYVFRMRECPGVSSRCRRSSQLTHRYPRDSLPARYRQRPRVDANGKPFTLPLRSWSSFIVCRYWSEVRRRYEWEIVCSPSSQLKLFHSLPIFFVGNFHSLPPYDIKRNHAITRTGGASTSVFLKVYPGLNKTIENHDWIIKKNDIEN